MLDHYTYRVSWSAEDGEYVGTCAEFPSLSHLAAIKVEALQGIEELIQFVLHEMQLNNEPIPLPIADRVFSGNFQTRIPSDLHRSLAIEAAEAGVSLNRLVSYKLSTPTVTIGMIQYQPKAIKAGV